MNSIPLSQQTIPLSILAVAFFSLLSCRQGDNHATKDAAWPGDTVALAYANGFSIVEGTGWTMVEVKRPYMGAETGYRYLLVPRDAEEVPEHDPSIRLIRTPVQSVVCTSTTHIPLLDYLDLTDRLVGFPTTDYISSLKTRARIDSGLVTELGVDKGLNLERLVSIRPELVVGYTMSSDYGQFAKIEELGIPVVLNAEYLEAHPLGRAEWIKFIARFFGKEAEADSVFASIENKYNEVMRVTADVANKPTVISGIRYGDAWFLPGGRNYAAELLDDASCNYLWRENTSTGYLELSFETVYEKAHTADLWIGVGPFATLQELRAGDHRYAQFKAFETGEVYNYDARIGSKGGNEYLELGYLRPDLILQDLVKIAHPELLPNYKLYFHRRLE